ncbi:tRNA-intron lyase [Thermogladius sp. 4427co]|uniref:tRNA-intron lyase n=1 Tax=Thermogladius sp. 4427co TaxID=3450718 RepID=UPI003F7ACA70
MSVDIGKCESFLLYNRVIVPDPDCASAIYWSSFYGSFLGIDKPRSRSDKAPLELSLLEALYLLEKKGLNVYYRGDNGLTPLTADQLYRIGIERVNRFRELYAVYKDLRERGFVVRRGLKFGCDFLIYRHGPGIDHAPFGVQVFTSKESVDPIEVVRMGRLLHSVRKKLIIAIVDEALKINYMVLNWWKP